MVRVPLLSGKFIVMRSRNCWSLRSPRISRPTCDSKAWQSWLFRKLAKHIW
nr:unnamed protein product [Callosobruchus analis]